MAFDFKKEYKEFYMPKKKPEIVNVPKANYIAIRAYRSPSQPPINQPSHPPTAIKTI